MGRSLDELSLTEESAVESAVGLAEVAELLVGNMGDLRNFACE